MNRALIMTAWRRLGGPGVLGGALLALSAWLHWGWLPTQRLDLDAAASAVRHLRHDLQQTQSQEAAATTRQPWDLSGLTAEAAWQTVWDTLPDDAQRVALLSSVTGSARKTGVNVASVQYRGAVETWSVHQGQALWRQRVSMPIDGRYGDVRAWLGTLLNQSNLSLDSLDINRGDTASDLVKGRVSLSLWWRTAAGRKP